MRGLPNRRSAESAPSGGTTRPTVSARAPMKSDTDAGLERSDTTTDAQPATTAFDARERLEGTYDGTFYFQFRSAGMAHGFSAGVGGGD